MNIFKVVLLFYNQPPCMVEYCDDSYSRAAIGAYNDAVSCKQEDYPAPLGCFVEGPGRPKYFRFVKRNGERVPVETTAKDLRQFINIEDDCAGI